MGSTNSKHNGYDDLLRRSFLTEVLVMLWMEKILTTLKNARAQIKCLGSDSDDINNAHIAEIDEVITYLEKPNPDKDGFYYWTVQLGVHLSLVQDGADFTDKKVHDLLTNRFYFSYGHELQGQVLSRPPDKAVAEAMGFTTKEYLQDRKKLE